MKITSIWTQAILGLSLSLLGGCATSQIVGTAPTPDKNIRADIVQIKLKFSNSFLIKSKRPVLIDGGSPWDLRRLEQALKEHSVKLEDIALVILTHGHADHAGLSHELQTHHLPIAAGRGDLPMLKAGENDEMKPSGIVAWMIKPFVKFPYPGITPEIAIQEPLDLSSYGIRGQAIQLPGHTLGSVVILLEDQQAFVGDMILGGALGGAFWPESPGEHYYQADAEQNRRNIEFLLKKKVEKFYLGHGGPVKAADVSRVFELHP